MSTVEAAKLEHEIQQSEKLLLAYIESFARVKKAFAILKAADLEGKLRNEAEEMDQFRRACAPRLTADELKNLIRSQT